MMVQRCIECGADFEAVKPHNRPVCSDLCRMVIKRRTRNRSEYMQRNAPPSGVCAVCRVTRLSASNPGLCCRPCWSSMDREQRDAWENRIGREAVRV